MHPLGDDMVKALEVFSMRDLAHITGTTPEQVNFVMNAGFSAADVPSATAISIIEEVLDTKLRVDRDEIALVDFIAQSDKGDPVPALVEMWWERCVSGTAPTKSCSEIEGDAAYIHANGWFVGEQGLTEEQCSDLPRKLATMLVSGTENLTPGAALTYPSSRSRRSNSSSGSGGREDCREAPRTSKPQLTAVESAPQRIPRNREITTKWM